MIFIAHRGNINGPSSEENNPSLINSTLSKGYHVEIDVWVLNDEVYLGHDSPTYKVENYFLQQPNLWCHAKNFEALIRLKQLEVKHYFWHDTDARVLTSSDYFWTYPGKELDMSNSIAVMPEVSFKSDFSDFFPDYVLLNSFGVCSDYVRNLKFSFINHDMRT